MICGIMLKLISLLKNGIENSDAMISIKSNLIQSINFNTHYAFVSLMNLRIISKYRRDSIVIVKNIGIWILVK